MASQLLQGSLELVYPACKAQKPLAPRDPATKSYHKILLPGFQMDSVLIPWITQSFKHMTGAVHCEHIIKEDWRQMPPYTALYRSWCRE